MQKSGAACYLTLPWCPMKNRPSVKPLQSAHGIGDATVDISRFKIVKAMFPQTAGTHARSEH
jgi:hypothetical protein